MQPFCRQASPSLITRGHPQPETPTAGKLIQEAVGLSGAVHLLKNSLMTSPEALFPRGRRRSRIDSIIDYYEHSPDDVAEMTAPLLLQPAPISRRDIVSVILDDYGARAEGGLDISKWPAPPKLVSSGPDCKPSVDESPPLLLIGLKLRGTA